MCVPAVDGSHVDNEARESNLNGAAVMQRLKVLSHLLVRGPLHNKVATVLMRYGNMWLVRSEASHGSVHAVPYHSILGSVASQQTASSASSKYSEAVIVAAVSACPEQLGSAERHASRTSSGTASSASAA